jgi:hypothetical protein
MQSATNALTAETIPNSEADKDITLTLNPLSDDKSTDTTHIQLHGLVTNRPSGTHYPV